MAEEKDNNRVPEAVKEGPGGQIIPGDIVKNQHGNYYMRVDGKVGRHDAYVRVTNGKPGKKKTGLHDSFKLTLVNKDELNENVAPNHDGKAAPYGSGYERVTKQVKESLRDWFKKENWVRINTSGNISGDCGTMKKGKATTRCLPKKKAQSLTKAQRKATVAKKVRGDKKGKQFVSNTKSAKYRKKSNEE